MPFAMSLVMPLVMSLVMSRLVHIAPTVSVNIVLLIHPAMLYRSQNGACFLFSSGLIQPTSSVTSSVRSPRPAVRPGNEYYVETTQTKLDAESDALRVSINNFLVQTITSSSTYVTRLIVSSLRIIICCVRAKVCVVDLV